jgi:Dyp-type peroxidase family
MFFKFSNVSNSKKWLKIIAERIPNTEELLRKSNEFKDKITHDATYRPQDTWLHVSLSATGVTKLGKKIPVRAGDPFILGMKKRAVILGDYGLSDPKNWVEPFKTIGVDGILIIASDQIDDADATLTNALVESTELGVVVVGIQKGTAITNEQGKNVEHFGFRDGVSQPLIKGIDKKLSETDDLFEASEFVLSGENSGWMKEGSFLVFRRLQQDVKGFWSFVRKVSNSINMSPEKLASKFVGRWDSGAPLAIYPNSDPNCPVASDRNDFRFVVNRNPKLNDPRGLRTPRFSHIRKVYPRDDGLSSDPDENDEESDKHRILRRGIPYGKQISVEQNTDRGLLFMCYQKNIATQFEFLQANFANCSRFPAKENGLYHGHDPIIGRPKSNEISFVNLISKEKTTLIEGLKQWVVTTGGEYFFSPSISALKRF